MNGKRISYAVAVAALLLVGAGCANGGPSASETTSVNLNAGAMAPRNNAHAGADAGVNVGGSISADAAVDSLVNDANDEHDNNSTIENDAAEVNSDQSAVNAYGDASYDVNATK